MTPDERQAVMRAFRKLTRPERKPLYALYRPWPYSAEETGLWQFTLAAETGDLTREEAKAVEKWLEEGK